MFIVIVNTLAAGILTIIKLTQVDDIIVSDEPWVHRLITHSESGREDSFRDGIRDRDGKCVISGLENTASSFNIWTSFQAAHIFPLESESYWNETNLGRWITDMDNMTGVSKINSCQNGFLLQSGIHNAFDEYLISVNPDVSGSHHIYYPD